MSKDLNHKAEIIPMPSLRDVSAVSLQNILDDKGDTKLSGNWHKLPDNTDIHAVLCKKCDGLSVGHTNKYTYQGHVYETKYALKCGRCGRETIEHKSLYDAVKSWNKKNTSLFYKIKNIFKKK